MKKLFVFMIALVFGTFAWGQTIFTQNFESVWTLPTTLVPAWSGTTTPGDNVWHQNAFTTGWTSTFGAYAPTGANTTLASARFHTYDVAAGGTGDLTTPTIDLSAYTAGTVKLDFYQINTSGTDVLNVFVSNDNGATWSTALAPSPMGVAAVWTLRSITLPGNSATTKIKFTATSDWGTTDIGIDEIKVYFPIAADAAPTVFTATAVTQTGMTIGWTDNSTNETKFRVYRSTDNITFTQQGADIVSTSVATTGTTYSQIQTSLVPGTTYYYRIAAVADLESSYLTGNQATNAAGTIVSTLAGGLWSSTATWVGGVLPTMADNVTIADGATVTVDITTATCWDLTVGQGTSGILNYLPATASTLTVNGGVTVASGGTITAGTGTVLTHALYIGGSTNNASGIGSLVNNGTFDMFTTAAVTVTFFGTPAAVISGTGATLDFYRVILNKGAITATSSITPPVLELQRGFTVQNANTLGFLFTHTAGTLKIGGTFTQINPVYTANYTIPAIGGIWLNNANYTLTGFNGSPTNNGLFRVSTGTYNIGTAAGNTMGSGIGSVFMIEGGNINVTGRFSLTTTGVYYNQSGGTLSVPTVGNTSTTVASFGITSNTSTFIMSGGTIILLQKSSGTLATARDYYVVGTPTITGGTLQVGAASTVTNFNFRLYGYAPNIVIDNTTNNKKAEVYQTTGQLIIYGTLTVNPGTTFDCLGMTASALGNVVNNGIIQGLVVGSRFDFVGSTPQTYSGTGTFGTALAPFIGTGVGIANLTNVTLNSPIVTTRVNLFTGTFINSNQITLGNAGASSAFIQRGGGATNPAGSFDVAPIFNYGTGGIGINYYTASNMTTSGFEIPASRTINSLTINNSFGATLNGGPLSTAAMTMTLGNINTTAANLLTVSGTATTAITYTAGYVNGPMARMLPASLVTGSTYNFPVGKGSYNPFALVNPTSNAGGTFTVQAEVFDANCGGTPGLLMGSLNSNRYWGASITNGNANFTNSLVQLNDLPNGADAIASSTTVGGSYNIVGGVAITATATSLTTTAPEITSLPGFFVMGNKAAATLTNLLITPAGNQCTNVARTVTVTATPGGGAVTGVVINYSINGVAQAAITMTNSGGNNWTGIIPTVIPANATITWSVTATDANLLTKTATGTPYTDEPTLGTTATASVSTTPVCTGSPTTLTLSLSSLIPATYIAPPAVTYPTSDEDVANITITQGATTILNNTSANNSLVGTIGTAAGTAGSYSNFTGFIPSTIVAGQAYNFSMASSTSGTSYSNAMAIYIDYNRNGLFTDAGEAVYVSAATTSGAHIETGSFTVPASAYNGLTRMRIIVNEGLVSGPTMTVSYGEYEEYLLNITSVNNGGGAAVTASAYSWSDGTVVVGTTNPLTLNPTTTSNYTGTATIAGCPIVSNTVNVVSTPLPTIPTANNSTQCGTAVPVCSVTSTTGAPTPIFNWYTVSTGGTAIAGITGANYTGAAIGVPTHFYVSEFNGTCESPRVDVFANVVSAPALTITADQNACNNTMASMTVTSTLTDYNTYTWSPVTNLYTNAACTVPYVALANASTVYFKSTTGGPVTYTCNSNNTTTFCSNVATSVITVQAAFSATASASPTSVCVGSLFDLSSTPSSGTTNILNETFNGATNSWITTNTSTGGTPANAAWTLRPDGYTYVSIFHSNDNSQFYMTNSDSQGSGGTTGTTLESPSFSTIGLTSCSLNFNQYYYYYSGDVTAVEINTGSGWTTLATYTANQGTTTAFASTNISLNSYIGFPNVKIRFNYASSWGYYWAIDNVVVAGVNPVYSYAWTSVPAGFTSSVQNPTGVTLSVNTTYNVIATLAGCSNSANVLVTAISLPSTPTATNSTQCGTSVPTCSVTSTSGAPTPVFNWYTVSTGGTAIAGVTGTSYTGTAISIPTHFYVSEFNGTCESPRVDVFANVVSAPTLTITADQNACNNTMASITVTSTLTDYNTYTWSPVTNLYTNAACTVPYVALANASTVYFKSTVSGPAVYTCTSNNTTTFCSNVANSTITVAPAVPTPLAGTNPVSVCQGSTTAILSTLSGPQTLTIPFNVATQPIEVNVTPGNTVSSATIPAFPAGSTITSVTISYPGLTALGGSWQSDVRIGFSGSIIDPEVAGTGAANAAGLFTYTRVISNTAVNIAGGTVNLLYWDAYNDNAGDECTFPLGASAATLTINYDLPVTPISWYNALTGGTLLGTGTTLETVGTIVLPTTNTPGTYNFYAEATSGSCGSPRLNMSVVINPAPATPTANNSTQCGAAVPGCSVTSTSGAPTPVFNWYTTPTGGTPIAGVTGTSYTGTAISVPTHFYVSEFNGTCESIRVDVFANVTTAPSLAVTADQTVCNNSITTIAVTSTLANFNTYTWSPVTDLYTNAACTVPYVALANASTVYVKSNGAATTYTCNSTNTTTFCTNIATTTVTTLPASQLVTNSGSGFCLSGSSTLTATPNTGYGSATFQWQSSTNNITFADIVGATSGTYSTGALTNTTYYRILAKIGATTCSTSNVDSIVVNNPQVLSTTPGGRCGTGTVNLSATGSNGSTLDWYTALTGGVSIGTGANFTTPIISTTTDFYVSSSAGTTSYNVGAPNTTISASLAGQTTTTSGINFDVLSPSVTVNSIDVYPTAAIGSTFTITVKQGATIVATYTGTTTVQGTIAAPVVQTVPVNFVIPNGLLIFLFSSFRYVSGLNFITVIGELPKSLNNILVLILSQEYDSLLC